MGRRGPLLSFFIISLHLRGHLIQGLACVTITPFPLFCSVHHTTVDTTVARSVHPSLSCWSVSCLQLIAAFSLEFPSADGILLKNDWQVLLSLQGWPIARDKGKVKREPHVSEKDISVVPFRLCSCLWGQAQGFS